MALLGVGPEFNSGAEQIGQPEIENQRSLLERVNALLTNQSFLIEVATACDQAYKEHFKKITTAHGEPIESWMEEPLLTQEEAILMSTADSFSFEQMEVSLLDYRTNFKTIREWIIDPNPGSCQSSFKVVVSKRI